MYEPPEKGYDKVLLRLPPPTLEGANPLPVPELPEALMVRCAAIEAWKERSNRVAACGRHDPFKER